MEKSIEIELCRPKPCAEILLRVQQSSRFLKKGLRTVAADIPHFACAMLDQPPELMGEIVLIRRSRIRQDKRSDAAVYAQNHGFLGPVPTSGPRSRTEMSDSIIP